MSKRNIPHYVCGVIPYHMLKRLAETSGPSTEEASANARATLEHMREMATGQAVASLIRCPAANAAAVPSRRKRRNVYDAQHQSVLPGKLVMSRHKLRGADVEVTEAYDGSGATYDFFSKVFGRKSIDGKGMRLDSTVHYGTRFENALWNGSQMVYGDGDGRLFKRFTASLDVIAHELTHGHLQHAAALGYSGQTGALNEHLADAFASMVKQWMLGQTAHEADWRIGAEILGPDFHGHAVRSLASPGTAYDDPVLGRDPQPSHMRDYVVTTDDHGGVHINSGILNHGFYLAAKAIGGKTWEVPGKIWYLAFTERLQPEADFADFTRATFDIAGELYGNGGRVQRIIAEAWSDVGLDVSQPEPLSECAAARIPVKRCKPPIAPKHRRRSARSVSKNPQPTDVLERRTNS
jgi:Zn-dependent metalloprotease